MIVTRNGLHFPKQDFVLWRKEWTEQLEKQKVKKLKIAVPCSVSIWYAAIDKRRRDVPGMLDALWHLLEKYELVTDDRYLGGDGATLTFHNAGVDKENPHMEVQISWIQ